ncbi:MAG: cobalamin-dependent protein [Desulfosporosinus sp.]
MKVILIHPPFVDPSMPALGLAYLSNALERASIDHRVVDANLEFWQMSVFNNEIYPWSQQQDDSPEMAYQYIGETLASILNDINNTYSDYFFSLDRCTIPNGWNDLYNIKDISMDMNNPFNRWYVDTEFHTRICQDRPNVIGISVIFEAQLLPAICLARLLKACCPSVTIILGGALFSTFQEYISEDTPFWDIVDGIIIGPGETALTGLVQDNGRWRPAKNVKIFQSGSWLADYSKVLDNLEGFPNFDCFPLKDYWAPGLVVPFRVLPSCSWNKCTFCADGRYAMGRKFSETLRERIKNLSSLLDKHNARGVYFVDAELTPKVIQTIMDTFSSGQVAWGGNARITSYLCQSKNTTKMYQSGCRLIRLGLESGSPNTLERMNKGIDLDLASKTIINLGKARIATHVYLMKGFPFETEIEWQQTIDFIKYHAQWIDMVSISDFRLYEQSPIWREMLKDKKVISKATATYWEYPEMINSDKYLIEQQEVLDLINFILDKRGGTRSCLTTAHTLLLSETFSYGLYSSGLK